jgi:hypothetical protein
MKTVLKLVIAVALLNAVVRGADSVWNYYQLKDAAERALLFGAQRTSQQVHQQIMERALELQLPLKPEDLFIRWATGRRIAEASYTQQVEFLPNYPYPVEFSFNVNTVVVGTPPDNDDYPPVYGNTRKR